MVGYDTNKFIPSKAITRGELVAVIARYLGIDKQLDTVHPMAQSHTIELSKKELRSSFKIISVLLLLPKILGTMAVVSGLILFFVESYGSFTHGTVDPVKQICILAKAMLISTNSSPRNSYLTDVNYGIKMSS